MDCENYSSRIYVKDLDHCMLNVTLFGKVVGLANNVCKLFFTLSGYSANNKTESFY